MSGSNSLSSGSKRPVAVGPVSSKLCCVCGKDVAQLPRVKDDQGRYFCKPCEARAAAQQVEDNDSTKAGGDAPGSNGPAFEGGRNAPRSMTSSPRAVGNGIYDTGDGLDLSAAVQYEAQAEAVELPKEQQCPSCRGHMEQSARVCIHCGYDRQRKTRLSTKVEKVKEAGTGSRRSASSSEAGLWFCAALGVAAVGVCWIPWVMPDLGLFAFLAVVAIGMASYITTTVCQFRDGETGWGIVSIVGFFLTVGSIANPLWAIGFSGRPWLAIFSGGSMVASIVVTAAAYFGPESPLREVLGR